jgi:predicted nucleic acid-binding protein
VGVLEVRSWLIGKQGKLRMGQIPPHVSVSFDACGFKPAPASEAQAARELRALIKEHRVQCDIPEIAALEMDQKLRAREFKRRYIVACNTQVNSAQFFEMQKVLFGTKTDLEPNERRDILNLLNAIHYLHSYFVTFDNHFLSKRDEIRSRWGIEVVKPSECLEILREYLR